LSPQPSPVKNTLPLPTVIEKSAPTPPINQCAPYVPGPPINIAQLSDELKTTRKDMSHHAIVQRNQLNDVMLQQKEHHDSMIRLLQTLAPPAISITEDRLKLSALVGELLTILSRTHDHPRGFRPSCPRCQRNEGLLDNLIVSADPQLLNPKYPTY
jgi:hypothetical protein